MSVLENTSDSSYQETLAVLKACVDQKELFDIITPRQAQALSNFTNIPFSVCETLFTLILENYRKDILRVLAEEETQTDTKRGLPLISHRD
jgi:hypothetical protein